MKLEFIAGNDPGFKLVFERDKYCTEPEIDVKIFDAETTDFCSSDFFGLNIEDTKRLIEFLTQFIEEAKNNG